MKTIATSALFLLAAFAAFGHAGEVHKYMGTVGAVNDDGSFELKKTDGKSMQVFVSKTTAWLRTDGTAATPADLTAGTRVVVTISKDGKTASEVKLGSGKAR